MPAKSIAQQRFMAMVKSVQQGKSNAEGKAKKAAKEMKPKDVDDFASTKHKGLPKKVKQEEAAKRDYKAEYKKFQSSPQKKKYRAELNAYNRKKGTYGNGDGKDASHKGGKIVGFEEQSKNRGRAEKSRLKKEAVDWKKAEKFITGSSGLHKFMKMNMKDLQYFVKHKDEKGLKEKLIDILVGMKNAAHSSGLKLEGKLTEASGKWVVVNGNDTLNIFVVKVVNSEREAQKIAKDLKQKDKYGRYQAVSVKQWNKAGKGKKIKEGKLTESSPYKTASRNELAMYISQLSTTINGTKDRKMLNYLKKDKQEVEKELKSRKTNEGILKEFNKSHFLNLIKQEIESLKGQIAYCKDNLRQPDLKKWIKKEFEAVLKDKTKALKDTEKHYKRVQNLKEVNEALPSKTHSNSGKVQVNVPEKGTSYEKHFSEDEKELEKIKEIIKSELKKSRG